MDMDVLIIIVVVGIAGIAAMADPSRTAEILRAVVDVLKRKHK